MTLADVIDGFQWSMMRPRTSTGTTRIVFGADMEGVPVMVKRKRTVPSRPRRRRRHTIAEKEAYASRLREKPTRAEEVFRDELQGQLVSPVFTGQKWYFQRVVTGYIPDFFEETSGTVVELDGSVHSKPSVRREDRRKERHYAKAGITVLRLSNDEVLRSPAACVAGVLQRIVRRLSARRSSTGTGSTRVARKGRRVRKSYTDQE